MSTSPTELLAPRVDEASPVDDRSEAALQELLELVQAPLPPTQYYREVLRCIAVAMGTPYAALEVNLTGEVIEHEFAGSTGRIEFWRRNLQEFLSDTLSEAKPQARLFHSESLKQDLAFLGVMLANHQGRHVGALALVVSCKDAAAAREQLTFLHCLTLVAAVYREGGTAHAAAATGSPEGTASAKVLNRLASFGSATELAFELTNKIRTRSSCDQVALGRVRGKSVRILSISGIDSIKKRSPQVLAVQAAMEECLDRGRTIVRQETGGGTQDPSVYMLHEQWRRESSGACVASIPLGLEGGRGAILSLRRKPSNPFSEREIEELRELVEPYVAGMGFVEKANRNLPQHVLSAAGKGMRDYVRPQHWLRKGMIAGALALALFVALGSVPYGVSTPCVLVPGTVHNVSAPFDAVLREASVVSGDPVSQGDVLCRFDVREQELERERLRSDREVLRVRHAAALAEDDAVQCALLQAQLEQLGARLDMAEREIERSTVRAPFDGIVLTGDLRERVGDQMVRGAPLFQVSPEHDWKLELAVPERKIVHLEKGLSGRFASRARPEESHGFEIQRIRPSAEQRNGATIYVVEAGVDFELDWLMAGMEGVARIETGNRPTWWVLSHGVLDRLRLSFWL